MRPMLLLEAILIILAVELIRNGLVWFELNRRRARPRAAAQIYVAPRGYNGHE